MKTKIIRCINVDGALVPEDGCPLHTPVIIDMDKDGQLWYWAPDDAAPEP